MTHNAMKTTTILYSDVKPGDRLYFTIRSNDSGAIGGLKYCVGTVTQVTEKTVALEYGHDLYCKPRTARIRRDDWRSRCLGLVVTEEA